MHTERMVQLLEVHPRTVRLTERSLKLKIRMLRAEVLETMLYGCVTWSPRACPYDTLRRGHHRFLTRCISWRNHNRADLPISYLDTLIKTESESIEATLRRRRILFAGFVARMENTRLPKCVMFGELVGGTGRVGGQEKERMECFLDDFRAFGINADQWTTAAQNEREWRRKAEQGAEHFMAKWIVAEKTKAGLRHGVVCPNVTGRTKDRVAQSKRGRLQSFRHQRRPVDDCSPEREGMAQKGGTRGGTFHGEMDRCRKNQGWTTAWSGMPERDEKNQGQGSPKQAGSCWFARPC